MPAPVVVILGAAEPHRGTEPAALTQPAGDKRVLDWLIEAVTQTLDNPEIHFVGGYQIDEIIDQYPDIHFSHNPDWETTGPVASLFTAPIPDDRPVYVCYADTIFEPTTVDTLTHPADTTTIAIDRSWQTRYRDRSPESLDRAEKVTIDAEGHLVDAGAHLTTDDADAEFTGLCRLTPAAVARARSLYEADTLTDDAALTDLLKTIRATDIPISTVDIGDSWAELETAEDLSRFVLDTKANTLRRLRSMVTESTILDQHTFTVGEWRADADAITSEIAATFPEEAVIVRSSALAEDSWDESNAGRFESVLDVPSQDPETLTDAIVTVIDSYPDDNPDNQVLVQPMIDDVDQSGVVMTRTLETASPYYVINYDATTASTESVTDGTGEHLQTTIVRKDLASEGSLATDGTGVSDGADAHPPMDTDDSDATDTATTDTSQSTPLDALPTDTARPQYPTDLALESLLTAIRELETLIGHDSLDVEFAIDTTGDVYILQTRPMTIDPAEHTVDDETLFATVDRAREAFQAAQPTPPTVLGDRTIYGVMPDWNPAEIIGRQPRRLATSLYRYLIMDDIWAQQRAEYGYRDVRPHPLMKCFAGQPYVDVRADFTSFIPASVPDDLAEQLLAYYLDRLEAHPEFHDKVEFDIVLTCLPFDYDAQIEPFLEAGFTREDLEPFREGLEAITHEAYRRIDAREDAQQIDRLEARYEAILTSDLPPLAEAYALLGDCRRLGTLPFAHLARTAFVATTLLRSLERRDVLTADQRSAFQNALNTVARQFERDGYRVAEGELSWTEFVDTYGHLRPGTYEITSPAYRDDPEAYLEPIVEAGTEPPDHPDPADVWDEATKAAIAEELDRIGLPTDVDRFIDFLVTAIEGREHSKFVFSRNLSRALECIATFGNAHGFSRDALSHVPIEAYIDLARDHQPADIEAWLGERVREGREAHAMTTSVELPPLLYEETDFLVFERPAREPNFVTTQTVTAPVVELEADPVEPGDIDGAIVLIEQADPGYDWLFGHDIAGLVTKYGGSNSHMAVRAAEFSLPAAIGVGENHYDRLRRAEVLALNCATLDTRVIQ